MIRKVRYLELSKVMEVVNEAWEVTIGDSGIAYKKSRRIRTLAEIEPYQNDFYILQLNGEIIGAMRLVFDVSGYPLWFPF